jgi:hypothetical protein
MRFIVDNIGREDDESEGSLFDLFSFVGINFLITDEGDEI